MPPEVAPFLTWAQHTIHPRLNGALLNWYDGALGHCIWKHRDSRVHLVRDAPIVTICLGESRPLRLRPWKGGRQRIDFQGPHGTVFVMPYETNLVVTHEVPRRKAHVGRRISVTLRAFA